MRHPLMPAFPKFAQQEILKTEKDYTLIYLTNWFYDEITGGTHFYLRVTEVEMTTHPQTMGNEVATKVKEEIDTWIEEAKQLIEQRLARGGAR